MLSTPRSLGFVLAAILGAMLVPGCRPEDGHSGPRSRGSVAGAESGGAALSSRPSLQPYLPRFLTIGLQKPVTVGTS
jgi:hypothetical protein